MREAKVVISDEDFMAIRGFLDTLLVLELVTPGQRVHILIKFF